MAADVQQERVRVHEVVDYGTRSYGELLGIFAVLVDFAGNNVRNTTRVDERILVGK